ncbi:MAG: GrpB family protein [Eubacteriales bacterium]
MKALNDMSLEELWELFPIVLKEYNPAYKSWYAEESENLAAALSGHGICRMSHIGSTSVEGLIAKPIVDILLELTDDYDVNAIVGLLQSTGWILMAQNKLKKTLDFNKGYTPSGFAEKVYHLHVKPSGDWDELYFRDYLIGHFDAARQYEALKLRLLEQFENNRDAYTNAKSQFVLNCTQKAREELNGRYLPTRTSPK